MRENGIQPGPKGREYVCKRLVQRILPFVKKDTHPFQDWIDKERRLQEERLKRGRRLYRKNKDKSPEWWWETHGLTIEDLRLLTEG